MNELDTPLIESNEDEEFQAKSLFEFTTSKTITSYDQFDFAHQAVFFIEENKLYIFQNDKKYFFEFKNKLVSFSIFKNLYQNIGLILTHTHIVFIDWILSQELFEFYIPEMLDTDQTPINISILESLKSFDILIQFNNKFHIILKSSKENLNDKFHELSKYENSQIIQFDTFLKLFRIKNNEYPLISTLQNNKVIIFAKNPYDSAYFENYIFDACTFSYPEQLKKFAISFENNYCACLSNLYLSFSKFPSIQTFYTNPNVEDFILTETNDIYLVLKTFKSVAILSIPSMNIIYKINLNNSHIFSLNSQFHFIITSFYHSTCKVLKISKISLECRFSSLIKHNKFKKAHELAAKHQIDIEPLHLYCFYQFIDDLKQDTPGIIDFSIFTKIVNQINIDEKIAEHILNTKITESSSAVQLYTMISNKHPSFTPICTEIKHFYNFCLLLSNISLHDMTSYLITFKEIIVKKEYSLITTIFSDLRQKKVPLLIILIFKFFSRIVPTQCFNQIHDYIKLLFGMLNSLEISFELFYYSITEDVIDWMIQHNSDSIMKYLCHSILINLKTRKMNMENIHKLLTIFDSLVFLKYPVCCSQTWYSPGQKFWIHNVIHSTYIIAGSYIHKPDLHWWNFHTILDHLDKTLSNDIIVDYFILNHILMNLLNLTYNFNISIQISESKSPKQFLLYLLENFNNLSNSTQFFELIFSLCNQYDLCLNEIILIYFQKLTENFNSKKNEQKLVLFTQNISDYETQIECCILMFEHMNIPLSPYMQKILKKLQTLYPNSYELKLINKSIHLKSYLTQFELDLDFKILFNLTNPNSLLKLLITRYISKSSETGIKEYSIIFNDLNLIIPIHHSFTKPDVYFFYISEFLKNKVNDVSHNLLKMMFSALKTKEVFSLGYKILESIKLFIISTDNSIIFFDFAILVYYSIKKHNLSSLYQKEIDIIFNDIKAIYQKRPICKKSLQTSKEIFEDLNNPDFSIIGFINKHSDPINKIYDSIKYNKSLILFSNFKIILRNLRLIVSEKIRSHSVSGKIIQIHRGLGLCLILFKFIIQIFETNSSCKFEEKDFGFLFEYSLEYFVENKKSSLNLMINIFKKLTPENLLTKLFKNISSVWDLMSHQTQSLCYIFIDPILKMISPNLSKLIEFEMLSYKDLTLNKSEYLLRFFAVISMLSNDFNLLKKFVTLHQSLFWSSKLSFIIPCDFSHSDAMKSAKKWFFDGINSGSVYKIGIFDFNLIPSFSIFLKIEISNLIKVYLYGLILMCLNQDEENLSKLFLTVLKWISNNPNVYDQSNLVNLFFTIPSYFYDVLIVISNIIFSRASLIDCDRMKIIHVLFQSQNQLGQIIKNYKRVYSYSSFENNIFQEQFITLKQSMEEFGIVFEVKNKLLANTLPTLSHTRLPLSALLIQPWEILQEELDCLNYSYLQPLINILNISSDRFFYTVVVNSIRKFKINLNNINSNYSREMITSIMSYSDFLKILINLIKKIENIEYITRGAVEVGRYFSQIKRKSVHPNISVSKCLTEIIEFIRQNLKTILKKRISESSEIHSESSTQILESFEQNICDLRKYYEDASLVNKVSKIESILMIHGLNPVKYNDYNINPKKLISHLFETSPTNLATSTKLYSVIRNIGFMNPKIPIDQFIENLIKQTLLESENDIIAIQRLVNFFISAIESNNINSNESDFLSSPFNIINILIQQLKMKHTTLDLTNMEYERVFDVQRRCCLSLSTILYYTNIFQVSIPEIKTSQLLPILSTSFLRCSYEIMANKLNIPFQYSTKNTQKSEFDLPTIQDNNRSIYFKICYCLDHHINPENLNLCLSQFKILDIDDIKYFIKMILTMQTEYNTRLELNYLWKRYFDDLIKSDRNLTVSDVLFMIGNCQRFLECFLNHSEFNTKILPMISNIQDFQFSSTFISKDILIEFTNNLF